MVLHVVGEILVLVVVGPFGCGDTHHRQHTCIRATAQHGAGHLFAFDEFFTQHISVVPGGQGDCFLHLRMALHFGHTDGRAFTRRLNDQRQAQHIGHAAHLCGVQLVGGKAHVLGRGQPLGLPDAFGHDFVHGHAGGHHTRAGVRNTQQLKCALHRAVFTVAAM